MPSALIVLLFVVAGVSLEARAQPADLYAPARRGWLGLAGQDLYGGAGVIVVDVQPGGPAAMAGLRAGDQLDAVNGRPIRSHVELGRFVATLYPGTILRLAVRRGGRVREFAVTLGAPPAPAPITRSPIGPRARPTAPAPSRGSSEWSCRAVGTYAPSSSTGGPDYSDKQNVDVTKWGPTRDAAGIAAIDACSGMLHLSANPTLSPGSLVLEECRVIRCSR